LSKYCLMVRELDALSRTTRSFCGISGSFIDAQMAMPRCDFRRHPCEQGLCDERDARAWVLPLRTSRSVLEGGKGDRRAVDGPRIVRRRATSRGAHHGRVDEKEADPDATRSEKAPSNDLRKSRHLIFGGSPFALVHHDFGTVLGEALRDGRTDAPNAAELQRSRITEVNRCRDYRRESRRPVDSSSAMGPSIRLPGR
jgi:hypothetical protein